VDDQNWKTTFAFVISMNNAFHRGYFLKNGVFPSKATWVNFLAKLASSDRYYNEAGQLNAIWYTLREDPDLIWN
jgi:hypothetical protein